MSEGTARIWVKRDASNLPGLPAPMRGEGFIGELVELARTSIPLDLEVPGVRVVIPEPVAESLQTVAVELLDFALQQLNFGHALSLAGVIQDNKTRRLPSCLWRFIISETL